MREMYLYGKLFKEGDIVKVKWTECGNHRERMGKINWWDLNQSFIIKFEDGESWSFKALNWVAGSLELVKAVDTIMLITSTIN